MSIGMRWRKSIVSSALGTECLSIDGVKRAYHVCVEIFLGEKQMSMNTKFNQSGEDYLETVLLLSAKQDVVHRIDVAKSMNVSQAAVNKAMKLLVERGYIYEDGKHLYLTERGKFYAEAVYEKHCVIYDFLVSLGVSAENAEADACHMEHVISEETFLMIKKSLQK